MSCRLGMNVSVWRIHGLDWLGKEELDESPVPVLLCPPQIPTWNDVRCRRPQKIARSMVLLIHVLCKWVCRNVRWGTAESHLMMGAAPTNVKQLPRIFSPTSCNKPKSQAALYSRHWIFAPCLASLQPWAQEGAAISWQRVCLATTRCGRHF